MHDDLSPAAQRAVDAAAEWRGRAGVDATTAFHLLLALTDDEDGRAVDLLSRHGLAVADLRRNWERLPAANSPALADALRYARQLARRHGGDATVATDVVLLAVIRLDTELSAHLEGLGLRRADLERAITGEQTAPVELEVALSESDPTDRVVAGRVLDAAFNRAREALRVLDDYCRFALDDGVLTGEVKALRHGLAALQQRIPNTLLMEARETLGDVGTGIGTAAEQRRDSPGHVARVNLKRLQEALRTLEEFGKLLDADLAAGLEQLRYRSYTLEKAVVIGTSARERLADARLYVLLTGSQCRAALDWTIREAAAGGATVFQLREKDFSDRELLERARRVRRWTREVGALLIINDRPDVARLVEADGVHLGQDDLSVKDARRIVGAEALIGVSTHDLDQVRKAVFDGASYIGVGPTFPSTTKSFDGLAGPAFVEATVKETSLPAFVIGGINAETIAEAVRAGASRVAVGAAVAQAEEPRVAAQTLRSALPV